MHGTKTYTAVVEYKYNSLGKVVRTESYVVGEELTKGKNIEETFYDENGNVTKSYTYNSLDSSSKFYKETERSENGKVIADIDETGENKTEYEYIDGTDVVKAAKLPNGSKLAYGHDISDNVTSISQSTEDGEENSTQTYYTCGLVTKLVSGNNEVKYEYDEKRRLSRIWLNGAFYESYTYEDGENGNYIVTVKNAKQELIKTERNSRGQITKMCKPEEIMPLAVFLYDEDGKITSREDVVNGKTETFEYSGNNLIKYTNGTYEEVMTYNEFGDMITRKSNGQCVYEYNNDSARTLKYIQLPTNLKIYPLTDSNGRNVGKEFKSSDSPQFGEYISYLKVGDHATNMPSAEWYGKYENNSYRIIDNLKYTYDNCGNISKITENGSLLTRYQYDSLNRLVREDNKKFGKTWLYAYDNNGNRLSKRETTFTLKNNVEECDFE